MSECRSKGWREREREKERVQAGAGGHRLSKLAHRFDSEFRWRAFRWHIVAVPLKFGIVLCVVRKEIDDVVSYGNSIYRRWIGNGGGVDRRNAACCICIVHICNLIALIDDCAGVSIDLRVAIKMKSVWAMKRVCVLRAGYFRKSKHLHKRSCNSVQLLIDDVLDGDGNGAFEIYCFDSVTMVDGFFCTAIDEDSFILCDIGEDTGRHTLQTSTCETNSIDALLRAFSCVHACIRGLRLQII